MGQIENLKNLGLTDKEIAEVLEYDKKIDRNEPTPFDLDKEKLKNVKEMTKTTAIKSKNSTKSKKKVANTEKISIIDTIFEQIIAKLDKNAQKTNAERQIDFTIGSNKYSITLTCHRS